MTPSAPELAGAVGRFDFTKTFQGDLEATGEGVMLSQGDPGKGTAGYVAIETVNGRLDDKVGAFALQQFGTMVEGAPTLYYEVVPGSGSGELENISGVFHLTIDEGGVHHYELEYRL